MAKIIDPDDLNQGTEVVISTAAKTIQFLVAGNLSNDGVAIQCAYSFFKEEWRSDSALIKYPFPMKPIDGPSGTQFNLIEGWNWADTTTTGLIRDGGWALKDGATSQEEWMNVTSLGSFLTPATDVAYYTQGDIDTPVDIDLAGTVNQAVKIYGDATHGNFDYRSDFIMYLREEAATYDLYDLLTEQNISVLTYKKYALPLSNDSDTIKVTHTDAEIALAPYLNIDITWHATAVQRTIDGVDRDFKKIIEGDSKTLEQIYEKHQYLFRQTTDIDEGAGTVRGDTGTTLAYFVGDTLYVDGYIDNVLPADANRVVFIDDGGTERTNPYVSAGSMPFSSALQGDSDAIYRMYFTNDDAGDNTGRDYGTSTAMLVHANSKVADDGSGGDITFTNPSTIGFAGIESVFSVDDVIHVENSTSNDGYYEVSATGTNTVTVTELDGSAASLTTEGSTTTTVITQTIAGKVGGNTSISFDYDYNNNDQRGTASKGVDAPVVLVGLGLSGAQFVVNDTGSITESKAISIGLVSSDELTYTNPA